MPNRRGALIPGVLLILLGAWLLARNLNLPVPGLEQLWPGILVLFGLGFLVQFLVGGRREEGLVLVGLAGTLTGADPKGTFLLWTTGGHLYFGLTMR